MSESAAYFEQLEKRDPYRIETMDVYSNVLFLENNISKLTFLAHRMSDIDKYRTETCCAIGVWEEMKGKNNQNLDTNFVLFHPSQATTTVSGALTRRLYCIFSGH